MELFKTLSKKRRKCVKGEVKVNGLQINSTNEIISNV
jgi:hypothetical protein